MEKWKVVGWRDVDFKDQSSGRQVVGTSLFLARPGEGNIHGLEVQKLFISREYVDYKPVENQMIGINFNRHGKVQSIEVL